MRKYSSVIPDMTLAAELPAGQGSSTTTTTITLNTGAWDVVNNNNTLTLVIAPGTANEEIVNVTDHTANNVNATILRGLEGTSNQNTHIVGTVVRHMVTALDLQEPHTHLSNSTDVHGLVGGDVNNNTTGGAVVGNRKTQTLYNKTLDGSAGGGNNTFTNIPAAAITGLSGVYAPLASPTFTGTPTAPTAADGTNTTQIATTAFVQTAANTKVAEPAGNGFVVRTGDNASAARSIAVSGTGISITNADGVLGNPTITFTGGSSSGVSSVAGTTNQISVTGTGTGPYTGAVTLSFPTGGIVAPTGSTVATSPSSGDNSTKIATTAFVQTAVAQIYASVYVVGATLSTDGVLSYTSENVKTATGMHSNSTNPSRLIATTAGKYKISATVRWSRNSTDGTCSTYLTKNGVKIDGTDGAVYINANGPLQSAHMETIITLALNDYVEVYGDVPGASVNYNSTFNFEYVGA